MFSNLKVGAKISLIVGAVVFVGLTALTILIGNNVSKVMKHESDITLTQASHRYAEHVLTIFREMDSLTKSTANIISLDLGSHHANMQDTIDDLSTSFDSSSYAEYACEVNGIQVDNLFVGKYFARFEPEQSKYMFCKNLVRRAGKTVAEYAPRVTVLKPHGCLSWHMVDGVPYSIPQAFFENSLIITPGINKYKEGYNVPFDTHRARANTAIDGAQRYIIIGYGFGDDHLETHLVRH